MLTWATMSLALGTEMLSRWGGYDRDASLLVSTATSELAHRSRRSSAACTARCGESTT
jgi:hypothetical protein